MRQAHCLGPTHVRVYGQAMVATRPISITPPMRVQCRWRRRGCLRALDFKRITWRSFSLFERRRLYLVGTSSGGWHLSQRCRSLQITNMEINKLIQIQSSFIKSSPWATCEDMDYSPCHAPRQPISARAWAPDTAGRSVATDRKEQEKRRDVGPHQPQRCPSPAQGTCVSQTRNRHASRSSESRHPLRYFRVKRTDATDLPAFETAITALVPDGTLKLPELSSLPSPA